MTMLSRIANVFANKHQKVLIVLLLLFTIPSFISIIRPNYYWTMHDDLQFIRQVEMEKCILDGQIPCRWTTDLAYGYGYPLFNYYPPLPYFVGELFRTFSFSFIDSIKFTAILQIVLSSLFMYLLASSLFGRLGGFLSALFYTYAPYHAVNLYVRGAMNEAWASVFFPLIFYFSYKFIVTRNLKHFLGLSLSFALLLLSHNPMVIAFTPILIFWCIYWLKTSYKIIKIPYITLSLFLSGLSAFGLSAFFSLPVLLESQLVNLDYLFTDYNNYSAHFATLNQLFISNFWGFGSSFWGPTDGLSFSVGYLHWILPLFIALIIFYKYYRDKTLTKLEYLALFIILTGLVTVFLTHEKSTFLWKIFTPLQTLQFPWRFLNITNFLLSLSIALLPVLINKYKLSKLKYQVSVFILLLLLIINVPKFIPSSVFQITDQQIFSSNYWTQQTSGSINDYLPVTTSTAPTKSANEYIDKIIPENINYQLTGQKKGSDWLFFNINLNKPAVVYLSQLAFPKLEITNHGNLMSYQIEPELGRVSLSLDAGQHQIYLKLRNTFVRDLANIISLLSITIFIILTTKTWKNSK